MKKQNIIAVMAAAVALGAGAQINSPAPAGFVERGAAMYASENYLGAMQQLSHAAAGRPLTLAEREELEYLKAMSAVSLGNPDARALLDQWLRDWPESPRRADVLMTVADCELANSFGSALKLYTAVNPGALTSQTRREDLAYRMAFCNLRLGEYADALALFNSLESSERYANAALFYRGYIAYARGDFRQARELFSGVNTTTEPGSMADYYLSQIYFMDGEYDKALSTARELLKRSGIEPAFTAEANRIAGESLYQLDRPAEAIPYLTAYASQVETPLTSTMYILGLSYYNNGEYEKAVDALRPVTDDDSAMGQNAYLYVGQALLKEGDNDGAIMAFDRAARMTHDNDAAEAAYYNYAVAKYMGGNVPFGSSVTVFEDFLTRFPSSRRAEQVRQYIINGYVTDNNYEAALNAINRASNPSAAVLAAKQRVLYTLGSRDLAAGNVDMAVKRLTEAEALASHNADYARETHLALGEALLHKDDYAGAERQLKAFLDNSRGASRTNVAVGRYDLGYVYLGQHQFAQAAGEFRQALSAQKELEPTMVADAYNRLADAQYYLKDFNAAAEAYDKAYAAYPSAGDYALFRKAMMQGYAGNFAGKLRGMRSLLDNFPTSSMRADAMLEMTEAQLRTGDNNGAIATWKELIEKYPDTAQGRQAYLQMALTMGRMGNNADADRTYREIITRYPTSDEAAQAAEILKREAADAGTLEDYIAFINTVDNAPKIDATEADRLEYTAAVDRADDKGDFSRLEAYVKKYPDGKYTAQAYGLLLENAAAKKTADAVRYANTVIDRWPDCASAETAYAVLARDYEKAGRAEDALANWTALAGRASSPEVANEARMGVLRMARQLGRAEALEKASQAILTSTAAGAGQKTEATFSLGMAQQLKGDNEAAIKTWDKIAGNTSDIFGAQAAVYRADALLKSGNPAAAKKAAEEFTDSDTPHAYWLARGFIVLADALTAQGKKAEAKEFLIAIRDNYPGKEKDIRAMVEQRLK